MPPAVQVRNEIYGEASTLSPFYSGPIRPLQRSDRQFVRSLEEQFPQPSPEDTARAFADQIVKVRSLHRGSPSHANKTGAGRARMSCPSDHRTLRERVAVALRRRVGIGKSVTPKQLAYALQISQGTIDNLMSGNNDPSGRVLMALLTFFDESFAAEILEPTGLTVAKLCDRRAAALRKVAEGMAELKAMESGR